jgi:hypothetical protein
LLPPDGLTATSATPAATAPLRLGDTGREHDRGEQRCDHGEREHHQFLLARLVFDTSSTL